MKALKRLNVRLVYGYKWSRDGVTTLRSEIWDHQQLAGKPEGSADPDERRKRLASIQQSIAAGTYSVPSDEVAASLLRHIARQRSAKSKARETVRPTPDERPNA